MLLERLSELTSYYSRRLNLSIIKKYRLLHLDEPSLLWDSHMVGGSNSVICLLQSFGRRNM